MASKVRLTALEASFLGLERTGLPMHVAGVVTLEPDPERGPITMPELRRHVAARIRRLPKFQQRISADPFGLWPRWTDARPVDLEAHLFHHELRHQATGADFVRVCAQVHAEPLPHDRPLWQMHLIDSGARQALIVKTHHSIADGVGGIHIAETLFDPAEPSRHRVMTTPAMNYGDRGLASRAMRAGQAVVGAAFTAAGGPIALPSPYNVAVGRERVVAFTALPMRSIRELKKQLGGSVDDVLLALVASGLRGLDRARGANRMPLRAMLPVSTWTPGRDNGTGNHVTAIFVDLPQDTSDLGALVARIAGSKAVLRTAHAAAGMAMMVQAVGLLPGPLHRAVVRTTTSLPFANLVVSDTPGPEHALALLGRRVEACYPLIPLPRTIGLSIAAVSLGGVMGIGISADPRALAHPERLAAEIARPLRTPVARPSRRRAAPVPARAA